jgi:hypothetical protein
MVPSTSPMVAAYMRASERASQMPLAAGTSAACMAREFHTSWSMNAQNPLPSTSASVTRSGR